MLTFFEYLRQRALESVLSGAQEALDILDREKVFEKRPTPINSQSQIRTQVAQVQADNTPADIESSETKSSEPESGQVDEPGSSKEAVGEPRVRSHHHRKGSRKS